MKLKNALLFGSIFMILYVIFIIYISVYTWSFGPTKAGIFTSVIKFFISFPINPEAGINSKVFMLLLFINGFIWGIVCYGIISLLKKLLKI